MKITRYINIDDSFINEPNKNRQGIKKVADEWYLKMQDIKPEEIRGKEIIDELKAVLSYADTLNDFAGISITKDGKIKELTSDTNKRKMGALAFLFKYMVEQFMDDNRDMRYEGRGSITDLGKKYRIIFHDWESIYRDVFIVWFCLCKIVPQGHFLNEAKIRHIETKPFIEKYNHKSDLSVEKANQICNVLISNGFIDCCASDFNWYFCGTDNRKNKEQPAPLKWKGKENEFVYFCHLICIAVSKEEYSNNVPWKNLLLMFEGLAFNEKNLAAAQNKIKNKGIGFSKVTKKKLDDIFN
jgi:hypothetical protein